MSVAQLAKKHPWRHASVSRHKICLRCDHCSRLFNRDISRRTGAHDYCSQACAAAGKTQNCGRTNCKPLNRKGKTGQTPPFLGST